MSASKKNKSAKQKGRGARKQTKRGAQSGRAPSNGKYRSEAGPRMSMSAPSSGHGALRAYAQVNMNPFVCPNPGVPTFPLVPSLKFTNHERGFFSTGVAAPFIGWHTIVPTFSNEPSTRINGTGDSFTNSSPAGSTGFPYTSGTFAGASNTLKGRIVQVGVRYRNITRMLDRGGVAYVFRDNDGAGLAASGYSVSSVAQLAAQGNWHTASANGEWAAVLYNKTDPDDYDYAAGPRPLNTADCMGIYAVGAGAQQTYEFEIVTHCEYIGSVSGTTLPGATRTAPSLHTQVLDAHINHASATSTAEANASHSVGVGTILADAAATGREIVGVVRRGVNDAASIARSIKGVMGLIAA